MDILRSAGINSTATGYTFRILVKDQNGRVIRIKERVIHSASMRRFYKFTGGYSGIVNCKTIKLRNYRNLGGTF